MKDIQLMLSGANCKVIHHTPQAKIDKALAFVDECTSGKRGFCYKRVGKLPLDSGRAVREGIHLLKRERMNAATNVHRAGHITDELATLRAKEKLHYQFDERTHRILRSNYDKLKRSLALLHREGEIEAYTLAGGGRLSVEFWTEKGTTYVKECEVGMPFDHGKIDSVVPTGGNEIHTMSLNPACKHGVAPYVEPKVTKGSGEYNPQRDADSHYDLHVRYSTNGVDVPLAGYNLIEWFITTIARYGTFRPGKVGE